MHDGTKSPGPLEEPWTHGEIKRKAYEEDIVEEEIHRSTAEIILSELTGKKQSSIRVAGIPGAMESISSLISTKVQRVQEELMKSMT
ncbi:hypothetical protein Sjap_014981 [Stephania japonica]|uniref:Uncharacterized protein n=1 Tax=Stephania japonica TaxID=461633 RepID=A0AAP0NS06_9MAGN